MTIASDFEIQNDKDIRYIGAAHGASGAGYHRVIDFHRWLQGLADEATITGDDYLDITRDTPSERATDNYITLINSYNIDDTAAEHLYDGSIVQTVSGSTVYYDGLVVIAAEGMDLQIVQNGAIIANDFWNTIPFGDSKKGLNRDVANGISHRFLLKVRDAGADIDGRRILCQTREWGYTFSEFKINGTARGNNVAALTYASDLNNQTLIATIAAMTDITNTTEGYNGIDVDADLTDEYYYSEWNLASHTINDFYERMKWLTRSGNTTHLYGIDGEIFRGITHQVAYSSLTGTFDDSYPVSWSGASAGTGQIIADNGADKMWIQILTGVAPVNGVSLSQTSPDAASATAGTITERTISTPFCGQSTGSSLIGAYGFGVEALDLGSTDKVFDLNGDMYQAPNYVTFTVGGPLVSGEDYVLVAPNDGGAIDFNQFTVVGPVSGGSVTEIEVHEAIPLDTPAAGTIRILRTSGKYTRHPYDSFVTATKKFNLSTPTDFSSDTIPDNSDCFISYIDVLASGSTVEYTCRYASGRSLFIRVRDGGGTPIKTFESTATFGAADMTVTAIRTSDL